MQTKGLLQYKGLHLEADPLLKGLWYYALENRFPFSQEAEAEAAFIPKLTQKLCLCQIAYLFQEMLLRGEVSFGCLSKLNFVANTKLPRTAKILICSLKLSPDYSIYSYVNV